MHFTLSKWALQKVFSYPQLVITYIGGTCGVCDNLGKLILLLFVHSAVHYLTYKSKAENSGTRLKAD